MILSGQAKVLECLVSNRRFGTVCFRIGFAEPSFADTKEPRAVRDLQSRTGLTGICNPKRKSPKTFARLFNVIDLIGMICLLHVHHENHFGITVRTKGVLSKNCPKR
jgi:hypothetical protein